MRSAWRENGVTVAGVGLSLAAAALVVGVMSTPSLRFAALTTFMVALLAGLHRLARRRTGDSLNLLSLTLVFYFVAFVVGGVYAWFAMRGGAGDFSTSGLTDAVALGSVSCVCLAAGYFTDPLRFIRQAMPAPRGIAAAARRDVLVVGLLVVGWSARLIQLDRGGYYHLKARPMAQTGASWFVFAGSLLPLVAIALAGAAAFGLGGVPGARRWRLPFFLLVAAELVWTLPSGSREQVVDLLVALVVVGYYTRGRLPSAAAVVALAVVLVFVLFPLVATYRAGDFRSSPGGALVAASSQVRDRSFGSTLKAGGDTLARFADVTAVARIFDWGRGRMNFSAADTVTYALEGFIPRALYPEKKSPSAFGNQFGRIYGFLAPNDTSTSIAVTAPGELYLGGGWLAVLLGIPLLGGLLRLLDEYLAARSSDAGVLGVYVVVAAGIVIGCETSIALGFVGVLKAAVFLALVIVAVGWIRPYAAPTLRLENRSMS